MQNDLEEKAREIAVDPTLTAAERAVLRVWTPPSDWEDRTDYPKGFAAEQAVLASLKSRGLFVIEIIDDPELGPCRRQYVTPLGRALGHLLRETDNGK